MRPFEITLQEYQETMKSLNFDFYERCDLGADGFQVKSLDGTIMLERTGIASNQPIAYFQYHPVPDDHYKETPTVTIEVSHPKQLQQIIDYIKDHPESGA